jgi:hypothetical protein
LSQPFIALDGESPHKKKQQYATITRAIVKTLLVGA